MTRGMYTSATGMLANQTALDAVSQNLANANTTGYKQDVPQFQSFSSTLLRRMTDAGAGPSVGSLGQGAGVQSLATDFSSGTLQKTDNPLDVALTGDASLVVKTPQGVRLTRDGALTRSVQGLLVQTNGGGTVLGQNNQPIQIPATAKDIVISAAGQISADGRAVGQLRLAAVSATSGATKVGDNLFSQASLSAPAAGSSVRQGYLETSNVSVIKEMVAMIALNRSYETNEKMLKSEDDATGKAVDDVAKV
jgi:flagellar basal-body rod protein FlgF